MNYSIATLSVYPTVSTHRLFDCIVKLALVHKLSALLGHTHCVHTLGSRLCQAQSFCHLTTAEH